MLNCKNVFYILLMFEILSILREQWIRAKYERKEFLEPKPLPYTCNIKEGYLWKKGKDDKAFQKRRFVLDTTENTLKYFNKDEVQFIQLLKYFIY